ncbi:MAG TPA: anaerobic ribonucleoside-triphosphate reductase activating protein [archaeon]|nr:anaerobic ribonucleoside-triphosphate reductase activating protein [archaeon]
MNPKIGSLIKTSLIDFPGRVASVVFFQGCNFRCGYCYNVEVVLPERFNGGKTVEEVFGFLEDRKDMLDGVVLLGGEPLLQPDIIPFVEKVKAMGLDVKLDTNGSVFPGLKTLIDRRLVDYVAMDVKAPLIYEKYYTVAKCTQEAFDQVVQSIDLLKKSQVPYEFRTTIVPALVPPETALEIAHSLGPVKKYVLQGFFSGAPAYVDQRFSDMKPYPVWDLHKIADIIRQEGVIGEVLVRE